jgi:hypothetical protein
MFAADGDAHIGGRCAHRYKWKRAEIRARRRALPRAGDPAVNR